MEHEIGRVEGKVALITGAASGIGKAAAFLLAREGAKVAAADIDENGARRTAGEITAAGGIAAPFSLDVASEEDWRRVIAALLEQWERLDILVNNAGLSFARPLLEMSLAEWRKVTAVNLDGVFLGAKYGVTAMRKSGGGSIVNISSVAGIKAAAGASAYAASKAAVRMFSKATALECAREGYNVRVNTVLPGGVITPMWQGMEFWQEMRKELGSDEAVWQALAQETPLGRFATTEEVAEAILYFASEASAFVTGADLVIDGGYSA